MRAASYCYEQQTCCEEQRRAFPKMYLILPPVLFDYHQHMLPPPRILRIILSLTSSFLTRRFVLFFSQLPFPTYFLPPFILSTCPILNAPLSGAAINLTPTRLSTTLIDDADPSILLRWRGRRTSPYPSLSFFLFLSHTFTHTVPQNEDVPSTVRASRCSHRLLYLSGFRCFEQFQAVLSSMLSCDEQQVENSRPEAASTNRIDDPEAARRDPSQPRSSSPHKNARRGKERERWPRWHAPRARNG